LDIDDEENSKLWVEYGSDAVPYYCVLADGKIVARFRGFLPYDHAEKFLRDALTKRESPREAVPHPGGAATDKEELKEIAADLKCLIELLGKSPQSADVESFRKSFGEQPEEKAFDSGNYLFYSWKSKGLSLGFHHAKLTAVHMYAEGEDGFNQYKGSLPASLSFADTRGDVEAKLGVPDRSNSAGGRCWVEYKRRGVSITFDSNDPKKL
jgi:hypothetical protein